MKKIIFLLFILISVKVSAQYTPMTAFGYQMKYLKTDSGFALPVRDTTIGRGVNRPGLMVINSSDSLPYYYNGLKWKPVYIDSNGIIHLIEGKVDSISVNGNYVFYWIGGLGYGQILNKLDSMHVSSDSVFTCIAGNCTFRYLTTAGTGTITQIIAGWGLVTDTITTSGTVLVDSSIIHSSAWNDVHYAAITHYHDASDIISGTLPIARGGTGLSGIGSVSQELRVAASGTALEYFTPSQVDSIYRTPGKDSIQFTIAGRYYAIKDGTGGTSNDTSFINTQYPNYAPNDSTIGTRTDSMPRLTYGVGVDTSLLANLDLVPAKWVTDRISTSYDTTNIPNFSVKVRSLFSATSPITYNSATGKIAIDTTIIHTSAYNDATYQGKLTLTTTGTSGPSTLTGNTLNIPQYSGGGGSGMAQTPSITTLINYSASDTVVYVVDSLRGGFFKYVSSGVTPDSGTVFNANGKGGGYWKRVMTNPNRFYVTWFGAKHDGVTNDGPAITLAVWSVWKLTNTGTVFFPNGIYIDSDTLSTSATFSGGVRYGGCNCQIPIPDNQTPFSGPISSHPLKNITFEGESTPNMFMSRLLSYPINTSGAIIYSTIQGSGTLPSVIGATGDSWTYGNINDAQVSMKNMNIRVRSNVSTGVGPTMSAVNFSKISSLGSFEYNLFDIDTALYYAVYPTAVTIGYYLPYANNSAFNPINNIAVGGYKIGGLFSEHTTGNNLSFSVNEYAIASIGAPHSLYFGRVGAQWNKYTIASATPGFASLGNAYIKISELDIETDTVLTSWTKSRYHVYDSLNKFVGDITYHNVDRGIGTNEAGFTKLGGTNSNFQIKYLGQYPDTTTSTGFATIGKTYNDSLALVANSNGKIDSLRNNAGVLEGRKNGVFVPQLTFPISGSSSNWSANADSLSVYRPLGGRVTIGSSTTYAKLGVVDASSGVTPNDTSGIKLIKTTAATFNNQQVSNVFSIQTNGWGTTGSASMPVVVNGYVLPVQGGVPAANYIMQSVINGVTTTMATFNSGGSLTIPASLTVNGTSTFGGISNTTGTVTSAGQITTSRNGAAATLADGLVSSNATASTAGVPAQWSCDIRLTGTALDAGSVSRTADWKIVNTPINGTTPITSKIVFYSNINAGGDNARFKISDVGRVELFNVLNLQTYTVATLPSGNTGDVARVSDATAPTYLGVLTGGGSVVTPVFYNGSAWVSF